jgi:hypothetical protein
MLSEAMPTDPNFIELAKTFGVGIATMVGWIYFLIKDIRDYKEKERPRSEEETSRREGEGSSASPEHRRA